MSFLALPDTIHPSSSSYSTPRNSCSHGPFPPPPPSPLNFKEIRLPNLIKRAPHNTNHNLKSQSLDTKWLEEKKNTPKKNEHMWLYLFVSGSLLFLFFYDLYKWHVQPSTSACSKHTSSSHQNNLTCSYYMDSLLHIFEIKYIRCKSVDRLKYLRYHSVVRNIITKVLFFSKKNSLTSLR